MDSFLNEPFLEKRRKYARWGSYIGFGALFVGLMTTTRSPLLAYLFLLIGLIGATFGSYMANRYVREPRPDQVFKDKLSELDKRYALYNYYPLGDHVMLSHYGITVLEPRAQEGEITYESGRWRHKAGFRKVFQLFGEPSLGKPDQDVIRQVKWVKDWIDEVMPEEGIPVNGVVVFTRSNLALHVSGNEVPIVKAEDLAAFMKQGLKGQPTLSTAKQKELRRVMDEVISQA